MNKKWLPITAGVLGVVCGTSATAYGLIIVLSDKRAEYVYVLLSGLPLTILGMLAIAGGISAIKKDKWPLVLAGATAGIFVALILICYLLEEDQRDLLSGFIWCLAVAPGIAVLPLVLLSRREIKNRPTDWIKILGILNILGFVYLVTLLGQFLILEGLSMSLVAYFVVLGIPILASATYNLVIGIKSFKRRSDGWAVLSVIGIVVVFAARWWYGAIVFFSTL